MSSITRKKTSPELNRENKKLKSEKPALYTERVLVYLFLTILTILCIFPFWILLVNSTRASTQIQKSFSMWFGSSLGKNWSGLMANNNIPTRTALINSIWISFVSAILTVYFSALTAYAIQVYDFKGKKFVAAFILAIRRIPTQVSAMGLVRICRKMGLYNQIWLIIVPCICTPSVYFYRKQYLESVLPYEIVEASRVDGSSEIRTFHQIVLPILKPALSVQFIFSFVASWNNYFRPAMLLKYKSVRTIPLVIANLKGSDPSTFDLGQIYLLMAIAVFPMLIVYLIFSRGIIKNLTAGSVKG